MTNKFGVVQVSPPTAPEHLDTKINELTLKMNKFIEDGSGILQKEQSDIEKHIEKMVEEEMAQEQRQREFPEEEKGENDRDRPYRGRGGMTRGTGRPKQDRDAMFDADSDEDKPADRGAYSKPNYGGQQVNASRGGKGRGRGGRPKINNDEDFPTL